MTKTHVQRRWLAALAWALLAIGVVVPVVIAAQSPYLVGRGPAYIIASFAGIICLALFLIQPLLAADYIPGPGRMRGRRWHRLIGIAIVLCVGLHVGGLYLTSPPDTLDALLLVSPTPFSVYGVLAMWGVVLTAVLVALRRKLRLRYTTWQIVHNVIALIVVVATVIHALQIEGTMGAGSKLALCGAVLVATIAVLLDLRVMRPLSRRKRS